MKRHSIKKKYVTRTIKSNECVCVIARMDTHTLIEKSVVVSGDYDMSDLELIIKPMFTGNELFVTVKERHTIETLYRITEQDFIKYGEKVEKKDEKGI